MENFDNFEEAQNPEEKEAMERRLEHLNVQIEYLVEVVEYAEFQDTEEVRRVFEAIYDPIYHEGVDLNDKEDMLKLLKKDIEDAREEKKEILRK